MIYAVVFLGLYVLRNFLDVLIQHKKKTHNLFGKSKEGSISLLLLFLSSLISALSVGYFLLKEGPDSLAFYIIGLVVFLMGFAGRVTALKELGMNYSQDFRCVPDGHLVFTGIYSIIRHPIYLFSTIEMVGFFVIKQNYISLAAVMVVILISFYRMGSEEKYLTQKFGNKYETYRKKTKRFIPFVF